MTESIFNEIITTIMNQDKAKKQIIEEVEDMLKLLRKQISDNQNGIQAAEKRIELGHAEINRSTQEIKQRLDDGETLAQKLATWEHQKSNLEAL